MAVQGEEIKKCEYCGEEFTTEHGIFCILPYRNIIEHTCCCVCNKCRDSFLAERLAESG